MSLSRKIAAALDENTRAYILPCAVTVEDGPNRLTLNLTALDTVGVAFDRPRIRRDRPARWSSEALKAWGERLAARVTYLMEPLRSSRSTPAAARSRSAASRPTARAEQRGFYEVRLFRQGTLRMERYVFDDATRQRRRTALPAHPRSRRTPGRRHRRQRVVKPAALGGRSSDGRIPDFG